MSSPAKATAHEPAPLHAPSTGQPPSRRRGEKHFRSDGVLSRLFGGNLQHLGVLQRPEPAASVLHSRCWELFRNHCGATHLHERFDHNAAAFYVRAEDPPISPEQKKNIRRLLFRRKMLISSPLVTSWEEQDPYWGRWVLSTLCYEEYGEFKILNNNHPRLNNPPSTLPPRRAEVHLCWGAGFSGAADASALQAVVALLLDDWRSALRGFRIGFHMHRLSPLPQSRFAGMAGPRWRDAQRGSLPPQHVIGTCFRRPSYADIALDGKWAAAANIAGRQSWRCAFVLESDLHGLGFSPEASAGIDGFTTGGWYASQSLLPSGLDHVIVVPPAEGDGMFLKVIDNNDGVMLSPIRTHPYNVNHKDYARLRIIALDLLLDELWKRTA